MGGRQGCTRTCLWLLQRASVLQALPFGGHELHQAAWPRRAQVVDVMLPVDVVHALGHEGLHTLDVAVHARGAPEGVLLEKLPEPTRRCLATSTLRSLPPRQARDAIPPGVGMEAPCVVYCLARRVGPRGAAKRFFSQKLCFPEAN